VAETATSVEAPVPTVTITPLRSGDGRAESSSLVQIFATLSATAVDMQRAMIQQAKLAGEFRDLLVQAVSVLRGSGTGVVPVAQEAVVPSVDTGVEAPTPPPQEKQSSVAKLEDIKRQRIERMRARAEKHRQQLAAGLSAEEAEVLDEEQESEDPDAEPRMASMTEDDQDGIADAALLSKRGNTKVSRQGSNRDIPDVDFDVSSILGGNEE